MTKPLKQQHIPPPSLYHPQLTAWSVAALLGPYMLNHIRDDEEKKGHDIHSAYSKTFAMLSILLAIGWVSNLLIPLANMLFPIEK